MGKTTREIIKEYGVSRQTLYSWFEQGLLKRPQKDFRNWFIWKKEDEENLQKILLKKEKENNSHQISDESDILKISSRRYLGSKNKLLGFIYEVVEDKLSEIEVVADIFAGTGVVADMFLELGKKVIVNDILKSNYISYNAWFGTEGVDFEKIEKLIESLNNLVVSKDNYVSRNFGNKYFSMANARKIGAIREEIDTYDINDREKAYLLTSLLYAMDKSANTVGHYDAYRKKMDSLQPLELKVPEYRENVGNEIYCKDANELVKTIKADLVYIDPPYNSRQYGDAYHLLENIIEWKKPKVEGVAKKMVDRQDKKSKYSLKEAPEAFDDLIQNIDAKYILVSYNNMSKKGSGRSNAKISQKEILNSLEKRGKVEVFETPFAPFTTGSTKIHNHKELLYLCTVEKGKQKDTKDFKVEKKKKYISSALNYTGGKYRLLDQILPFFPQDIDTFYDIFAGGGNVGINVEAKHIYLNDINKKVISLYDTFRNCSTSFLIQEIEKIIGQYNLSNTKKKGYDFYLANSSEGLKKVNEQQYLRLRTDYNEGKFKGKNKDIALYVLIVYAFNNQIRFNQNGDYNMPPGKRDFNSNMEKKLISFQQAISQEHILLSSQDFRCFEVGNFSEKDFIYLDPPYLISTATYNENGGWDEEDEIDLYNFLDSVHEKNVRFALSNVIEHKGKENILLKKWAKKYKVNYLDYSYKNSNYQSKNNKKTVEVLVTNY